MGWLYDLVTLPDQVDRCNDKRELAEDLQAILEDEIDDLEDEVTQLRQEIAGLKSSQDVAALRNRIRELESSLRTHNQQ